MGTKTFNNYEDLLTFTRASKGHALRPVSYGSELVTNGTFATDSDWIDASTGDGSSSISGGKMTITDANGGVGRAFQNITIKAGSLYEVSFEASGTNSIYIVASALAINSGFSSGKTHVLKIVASASDLEFNLYCSGSSGSASIDNLSIKEVLFDQTDGTLTLFEHPDNIPRVEWDAQRNRLGLLVEEARTNLVYGSTSPPTDGSSKNPSNKILSPTQEVNADLVVENTSTSAHGVRRTSILPTQGATDYTISVFAKAKERRYLQLRIYANGTSNDVFGFDLQEGTAPAGGSIQDVGNGWYRCSATLSVNNSTGGFNFAAAQMGSDSLTYYYAGDGSSGMYIFGLQVEAGSFPTSYIKNEGLSGGVTRSADVASIPVADFGYNQRSGSFLVDFRFTDVGDSDTNYLLFANNSARFFYDNAGGGGSWYNFDGSASINYGTLSADGSPIKAILAMDKDGSNGSVDGGTITTSSATPQDNVESSDDLDIGNRAGGNQLNGHIKSIKYYPRRLTNAQLQALTEPRSTPTLSLTFDGLESSYTENYIHG